MYRTYTIIHKTHLYTYGNDRCILLYLDVIRFISSTAGLSEVMLVLLGFLPPDESEEYQLYFHMQV